MTHTAIEPYDQRVSALESEGLTTSDAQAIADMEFGFYDKVLNRLASPLVNECRKCDGPVDVYGEGDLCASCLQNTEAPMVQ